MPTNPAPDPALVAIAQAASGHLEGENLALNKPLAGAESAQSATETEAQRRVRLYDGGSLDVSGCDLKGVTLPTTIGGWLNLSFSDLKGVTLPTTIGGFKTPSESEQKQNLINVARAALAAPDALHMSDVHKCDTTHCIAGWATTLHPDGAAMEQKINWETAGLMLLGAEAHSMFYSTNEQAKSFLHAKLAEAA